MGQKVIEATGTITVKVVTMGKGITQFVREAPLTLGTVLDEVGINGQMEVRVNGAVADRGHRLATGDMILVVPKIRGGSGRART